MVYWENYILYLDGHRCFLAPWHSAVIVEADILVWLQSWLQNVTSLNRPMFGPLHMGSGLCHHHGNYDAHWWSMDTSIWKESRVLGLFVSSPSFCLLISSLTLPRIITLWVSGMASYCITCYSIAPYIREYDYLRCRGQSQFIHFSQYIYRTSWWRMVCQGHVAYISTS